MKPAKGGSALDKRNSKSDKKKTKELDCEHIWKINISDFGLICKKCKACKMGKGKRIFWRVYKNPTQQRTELLEEILREVIGEDVEITRIDWKESMGEYKEAQNNLRQDQREKLDYLLNK